MMNNRALLSLAIALLTTGAAAQVASSSTSAAAATVNTASATKDGTPILVELKKTLNAKKVRIGDEVKAEVIQDVVVHGKIAIRQGSKLIGHVTQAKPRTKEDGESLIGVLFDRAVLKGGGELELNGGIRAIAASVQVSMVDKPSEMMPPSLNPSASNQSAPQPMGGRQVSSGRVGNQTSTQPVPNQPISKTDLPAYAATPINHGAFEHSLLSSGSRGVFGLPGLKLRATGPDATQGYLVTSTMKDVKLESGIQILLQVNNPELQ